MSSMRVVPTVTEDDLRNFGLAHFPSAPLPESFFPGDEEYYEEDDGLGYYDDGVKRTLTDEQIAIFRSSEIEQILVQKRKNYEKNRKRNEARTGQKRKAAENLLAQHKAETTTHHSRVPAEEAHETVHQDTSDQVTHIKPEIGGPTIPGPADGGVPASAPALSRGSTPLSAGCDADSQRSTNFHQKTGTKTQKRRAAKQRKNLRKEAENEEWAQRKREKEEPTPRRIARELDEQKEEAVDLEY